MKYISAILASLFLFSAAYAADTGVWYTPARNGEGINVITRGPTQLVYFYTYRDDTVLNIPPTVSPAPPELEQVGKNLPAWYLGIAQNFDGQSSSGEVYAAEAYNFPFAIDGSVAAGEQVGTFELVRSGEGWILNIEYSLNYIIPGYVSFYGVHEFSTPLVTVN